MPGERGSPVLVGAGVFGELPLFHHALELEGSVAALFDPHHEEVPADVLLKVPLHLSAHVDLFAGAGPMMVWSAGHGVGWGGKAAAGMYYWASRSLGLMLEADYAGVDAHGHVAHGVETAVGLAWRL